MLDLRTFVHSKNMFLIPYLGNVSRRKNFSGWYRGKITREGRHEFYLITRGQGTFTVGEKSYEVAEGDLVYIPSLEGIRYDLFPEADLVDYYAINLTLAIAEHTDEVWLYDATTLYHYPSVPSPENTAWSFQQTSEPLALPTVYSQGSYPTLRELLSRIYHIRTDMEPINFWTEKNILQQFLCEITPQDRKPSQEDMNTRRLHKLTSYIKKHYAETITLDTLCSLVNLSPSYIIRLFRQYTSVAPMAYVALIRIEKAKELLAESPLSISEIALMVGFQDSFYFSRKFKQITGITPRQYRRNLP